MLPSGQYDRIRSLTKGIGLQTSVPQAETGRVWETMKRDKKFIRGRNRFVLLEAIGRARVVEDIDSSLLEEALDAHLDKGTGS